MVDSVIIWRRRIPRLVGHNLAHLVFLIALIGVVSIMSQGGDSVIIYALLLGVGLIWCGELSTIGTVGPALEK